MQSSSKTWNLKLTQLIFLCSCCHPALVLCDDGQPNNTRTTGSTDTNGYQRIIGGSEVTPHSLPFMLSTIVDGQVDCGASLLSPSIAITATHCTYQKDPDRISYEVIGGAHNINQNENTQQRKRVIRKIEHPQFDLAQYFNDVSLLLLDSPFQINQYVQRIPLPPPGFRASGDLVDSGWGCTRERCPAPHPTLLQVTVPVVTDDQCRQYYPQRTITDYMLCAGYDQGQKDACQGDSGGPLTQALSNGKRILVGIVSWGEGCARPRKPGVYTEVEYFLDWIKQQMSILGENYEEDPSVSRKPNYFNHVHQTLLTTTMFLWVVILARFME